MSTHERYKSQLDTFYLKLKLKLVDPGPTVSKTQNFMTVALTNNLTDFLYHTSKYKDLKTISNMLEDSSRDEAFMDKSRAVRLANIK